jgi:glycosyltransferase involved in cell wall biosynthesis
LIAEERRIAKEEEEAPIPRPRVRAAVAIVMAHFPRIDEAFILREIDELERRGQSVVVVPIVRDTPHVIHEEAKPWMKRALWLPFLSRTILASNLRGFFENPVRYLRMLWILITRTLWRPSTLLRSLGVVPKAVHAGRLLKEMGITHVHAHFATHATTAAWIMAMTSDLAYSFTVHGPDVFVHRFLLREKIRDAKFIRCVSIFNQAFLSGIYPRLTAGKLEVIHSGVDPDVYANATRIARRRARVRPLILSIASLTPRNGFPFLIDACAQLVRDGVDFECQIVGDGPLREPTEQWITRHGLIGRVRILGNLPQHEVARLMGEADVFVSPNVIAQDGQMDGIPLSLVEAMAAGKPVIASAISGVPELVRNGVDGILVDAAYPSKLAQAVRQLLDDAELRKTMGAAGQRRVSAQFNIRDTATALIVQFDRVAAIDATGQTAAQRIAALDWTRLGIQAIGLRRVHEERDVTIGEVTASDGIAKRDVVVHLAPLNAGAEANARNRTQFEALSVLLQSMGNERARTPSGETITYSVPRLLMYDEAHSAVVIERADGRSLHGLVRESGWLSHPSRLAVAVRRAGTWLRMMQEQTRGDEDSRHVRTAVVLLALNDVELAAAADTVVRRNRELIREQLRRLENSLSSHSTRVVGHHGSFRPRNIFIGERRVDVVDFGLYREGLPLEDVAQFLIELEIQLRTPFARRQLPRLQREFLHGYSPAAAINEQSLRLCSLTKALEMLARCDDDLPRLQAWRRRRALHRIITRNLS